MIVAALVLYLAWFTIAFGIRTIVHRRRTGDSGLRGLSGRPGSAPWWAGVLFALALLTGLVAPVAALLGLDAIAGLDASPVQLAGLVVAVTGVAATAAAQAAMGTSWRVGVDPAEQTGLVTTGAFGWARNPIFTAMTLTAAGLTLMVPNVVAVIGFVALVVAIQLQVRVVEEPYLRRVHGHTYTTYAAKVGRFLPRVGRIPQPAPRSSSSPVIP